MDHHGGHAIPGHSFNPSGTGHLPAACLQQSDVTHYQDQPYMIPQQSHHHLDVNHSYDPNLSSAARYSPPHYNTISTIDLDKQLQEIVQSSAGNLGGEEYPVDANAVSYNNVIFVPNNGSAETDGNGLLDSNQSYVLASDSRFFGSYIQDGVGGDDGGGGLISGVAGDQANSNEYHGYQIYTETGEFIETITGCEKQEIVDMETGDTQIIIQGTNGQFYRQINQNVYVNDGDGVVDTQVNAVEVLNNETIVTNYDQTLFQCTYEDVPHLNMKPNDAHPMDGFSIIPSIADAELLINSASYGGYKHDYGGLDNDGLLAAHHLIDLGGDFGSGGSSAVRSTSIADELAFIERQHERSLLESTMSPLLAAVNDITSRDEHLQQYLDQSSQNTAHHHAVSNYDQSQPIAVVGNETMLMPASSLVTINEDLPFGHQQPPPQPAQAFLVQHPPVQHAPTDEYVDINEMEFYPNQQTAVVESEQENQLVRRSQRTGMKGEAEAVPIGNKHVQCRAWESVPTSFLCIGFATDDSNEHCVLTKKHIPLRTKFGPIEGDIKCLLPSELSLVKNDASRRYPVLFVDDIRLVDVSNEYTSNWMRFVRLAHHFDEQNVLLEECDDRRLYFRSCQLIGPRQEIKVGYSEAYARRYGLRFLEPISSSEQHAAKERWPCFECGTKFETFDLMQTHLHEHEVVKQLRIKERREAAVLSRKKRRVCRRRLTFRKVSGPTVRYACCFCSQVFSTLVAFKKHNEAEHHQMESSSRVGMGATHTSVLQNSNKDNRASARRCHQCKRSFPSAARFEKHRRMHCISDTNNMIQCKFCAKTFFTHSAMAMHVKSHQDKSRYFHCVFCSQRFQQASHMMNHVPQHLVDGFYNCTKCTKKFPKYVDLRKHVRAIHTTVTHPCPDCGKHFKSPDKLRLHRLSHSEHRAFACEQCDAKFKRKDKLRVHVIKKHSQPTELEQAIVAETKIRAEKTISRPKSAATKPSADIGEFECEKCDAKFKRNYKLRLHMAKKHLNSEDSVKKSFECETELKKDAISPLKVKPLLKSPKKKARTSAASENVPPIVNNELVRADSEESFEHSQTETVSTSTVIERSAVSIDQNANQNNQSYSLSHKPTDTHPQLDQHAYYTEHPSTDAQTPVDQNPYYDIPVDRESTNSQQYYDPPAEQQAAESIDYQHFIYKCHLCRLGFKRRGMLVNHLVKVHPNIDIETVPELNLPILKAQRYYYCAYCDKVYKSNSKRKLHILKNHPGLELPLSCKVSGATVQPQPGLPNASYSEPVGNVSALPQHCAWCHKQYASKSRLLWHMRKAHPDQSVGSLEMDNDEFSLPSADHMETMNYKADDQVLKYVYEPQVRTYTETGYYQVADNNQHFPNEQFGTYLPNNQPILYHTF